MFQQWYDQGTTCSCQMTELFVNQAVCVHDCARHSVCWSSRFLLMPSLSVFSLFPPCLCFDSKGQIYWATRVSMRSQFKKKKRWECPVLWVINRQHTKLWKLTQLVLFNNVRPIYQKQCKLASRTEEGGTTTKNTCNVIGFVVHRKLSSVFLSLKHRPGGERGRGRSVFCYKCKIFRQTKTKTS